MRLTGRTSNRDAIGVRVRVVTASGKEQWNHVTSSVGYASSSERAVQFGLGQESRLKLVEIRWPGGLVQRLDKVEVDRYLDVREP